MNHPGFHSLIDTLPLLMLCLGSLRVSPSQHLFPLSIMKRDLLPIQELFEWSSNFDSGVNPYCVFMDLIGYSEDRYGTHTYFGKNYQQVLGYKELVMLGQALQVFESRGYDEVYQFLDYLEPDAIPSDELLQQWESLGFNEAYATA